MVILRDDKQKGEGDTLKVIYEAHVGLKKKGKKPERSRRNRGGGRRGRPVPDLSSQATVSKNKISSVDHITRLPFYKIGRAHV